MAKSNIRSRNILKPEHRKPYQTTAFIYKALDEAELQVEELLQYVEKIEKDNRRLNALSNQRRNRYGKD